MSSRRDMVRIAGAALGVLAVTGVVTFTPSPSTPSDASDQVAVAQDMATAGGSTPKPDYLDRVVIARMYQDGRWTIPQADDYRQDHYPNKLNRRIAYVCEALVYLRPTYVSGLIRLDWKDGDSGESMTDQVTVYDGVRKCVRDKVGQRVKFDVVLNALHYTDPKPKGDPDKPPPPDLAVPSAEAGAERLRARLRTAHDAFHPDGWFFDFYASPYKKGTGRFPEALEAGVHWIHDTKVMGKHKSRQFVGGTIWGTEVPVPPGSDFISVTDRGGMDYTKNLVEHFRHQHTPIVMHIDNDPQNPDSKGSQFYDGSRDGGRNAVLQRHVNGQSMGYSYMFPVFFPFKEPGGPAFDMRHHPELFKTMCEYARGDCGAPPSIPDQAKPAPPSAPRTTPDAPAPPPTNGTAPPASVPLRAVHRGYNPGAGQHLFTGSLDEITQAARLHVELENAFYLDTAPSAGLAPFHRCYLGNGWHLLTGPGCEGVPGAVDEGALGYLATTQLPGTTPLYRMSSPASPTTSTPRASPSETSPQPTVTRWRRSPVTCGPLPHGELGTPRRWNGHPSRRRGLWGA